ARTAAPGLPRVSRPEPAAPSPAAISGAGHDRHAARWVAGADPAGPGRGRPPRGRHFRPAQPHLPLAAVPGGERPPDRGGTALPHRHRPPRSRGVRRPAPPPRPPPGRRPPRPPRPPPARRP